MKPLIVRPLALFPLVPLVSLLAGAGCVGDIKGNPCNPLEMYTNDEGDAYCPDPDAPDDCQDVSDALLSHFTTCPGVTQTPDELRALTGELLPCDDAVATSTDYDDCLDALDEECTAADPAELALPPACRGVVLTSS